MRIPKKFLIGLIILWFLGFVVVWGLTFSKKISFSDIKAKLTSLIGKKPATKEEASPLKKPDREAEEAIPVRCYKIALTDFKDDLPVMGTVKGALEITLKFEINGVIEAINFREGDVIYKGDLIASLNKKDTGLKVDYAKGKLESARVQLLAAKKKLEIFKNLYEIGGIIKAKLEEVELEEKKVGYDVQTAEVELASANSELAKTDLSAPRDGVLGSREAEVGEFVTPQDKIAMLYDTMKVFVELGIVEKDIDKIALGRDVAVKVDAHPGMDFKGVVDNVFPVIEGKTRTLTVRVGIDNPDALLLPGMFARAVITVAEFKDAIVVPSLSINRTDDGYKIFVVNEKDNTVTSRLIQVAYVTTDYTVVASGIYEDEIVIVDTPQELKDGMSVDIIEIQESTVAE